MKTHKTKQGALKAARAALGDDAIEGVDFNLHQTGAGWTHEDMPPANQAAEKAQAKRVTAPKEPKPKKGYGAVSDASREAIRAKKAPKEVVATSDPVGRGPTKADAIMAMLTTAGGATSKEIEEATGWQPHSVRGFLGTLRKKGVAVEAKKLPKEPTIYRIAVQTASAEPVGDVV
jgi:hypothetical protein